MSSRKAPKSAVLSSVTVAAPSKSWRLIDIGVNLCDGMYQGLYHHGTVPSHSPDVDLVCQRAGRAGVAGMLITGGTLSESISAIELAIECNRQSVVKCFTTVGCHPTRCKEFVEHPDGGPDGYFDALASVIERHRRVAGDVDDERRVVAAIGECGLDYDRLEFCPKEIQLPYFEKQFELARRYQLPMFLHNRNCDTDFSDIVRRHRSDFSSGVVHSFTGSPDELQRLLHLDLYIGVNGCSLKTEENLAVAKMIPLDRLMIETDAPWCDVRPTHASRRLLDSMAAKHKFSEPLSATWLLRDVCEMQALCKKEKYVRGAMVKSRNEPCAILEVLETLFWLHHGDIETFDGEQDIVQRMVAFADRITHNTTAVFGL